MRLTTKQLKCKPIKPNTQGLIMKERETTAYSVKLITKRKLDAIAGMLGISKSEVAERVVDFWIQQQNQETCHLIETLLKTQVHNEE